MAKSWFSLERLSGAAAAGAFSACLWGVTAQAAMGFGGEDVVLGDPWHHEDITCRAIAGDTGCGMSGNAVYQSSELGFAPPARHAIEWHADYIDSYLYSPLWWVQAGRPLHIVKRFKASRSNYWHLASLHFDDLNDQPAIEAAWRRYMAGLLVGLNWAADEGDIDAAHNLLGLSLHAVEDFYSHSQWINDPTRRKMTYLSAPDRYRRATLMTGAYERELSPIQHGKFSFICSVLDNEQSPLGGAMNTLCAGILPTSQLSICEQFRECSQGRREQAVVEVFGQPGYIARIVPPGIAMDSTWLARIGADFRGLTRSNGRISVTRSPPSSTPTVTTSRPGAAQDQPFRPGMVDNPLRDALNDVLREDRLGDAQSLQRAIEEQQAALDAAMVNVDARANCEAIVRNGRACQYESDYLFAEAKNLAILSAREWLGVVDAYMQRTRPDFWADVKNCTGCPADFSNAWPPGRITANFENYSKFPLQFLAAGHDGPVRGPHPEQSWYLRLELKTADIRGAGTGADVYAIVNGESFLLDYLAVTDANSPIRSPFLTYNDFERGDRTVYTIGPLAQLPTEIQLFNDTASGAERRSALRERIKTRLAGFFNGLRKFFRSLQDYVGWAEQFLTREQIELALDNPGRPPIISEIEDREQYPAALADKVRRLIAAQPSGGAERMFYSLVNGGDEGQYLVQMELSRTGWQGTGFQTGWTEYQPILHRIFTIEEARRDGGTNSDEPFFFFGLTTYGTTQAQVLRTQIFENVDSGDVLQIGHRFAPIRLPPYGPMSLMTEVWEHDADKQRDRDEIWARFTGLTTEADQLDFRAYAYELGRSIASDWTLGDIRVHAFNHDGSPRYGKVLDLTGLNRELGDDEVITLPLNVKAVQFIGACVGMLSAQNGVDCPTALPYDPQFEAVTSLGENRLRPDLLAGLDMDELRLSVPVRKLLADERRRLIRHPPPPPAEGLLVDIDIPVEKIIARQQFFGNNGADLPDLLALPAIPPRLTTMPQTGPMPPDEPPSSEVTAILDPAIKLATSDSDMVQQIAPPLVDIQRVPVPEPTSGPVPKPQKALPNPARPVLNLDKALQQELLRKPPAARQMLPAKPLPNMQPQPK